LIREGSFLRGADHEADVGQDAGLHPSPKSPNPLIS
jgi:hypothetical protein